MLLLVSSALRIEACTCSEFGVPPCEEYRRASAVFVGRVRAIIDGGVPRENRQRADVRFDVEQVFKGNLGASVDVGYMFNSSCSWSNFELGDRWLVYAYPASDGRRLQIPFCTGSGQFNETNDDAVFLQNLRDHKTEEFVMLRIPVASEIDVSVSSNQEMFRAVAAEDSLYRAKVPQAGKYKVKVTIPFAAQITSFDPEFAVKILEQTESRTSLEYEVEVEKGLCSWRQVEASKVDLKATASIGGKLLDAERRPVSGVPVFLAKWNIDETEVLRNRDIAFPDKNGGFLFGGLREGKYVVLVNPYDFPEKDVPYLKGYLPGVLRFSDAFVIELEQGKEANVIDFVLPRKLSSRTVELQVVWPNGKPVTHQNPAWNDEREPWISVYKPIGDYLEHPNVTRLARQGVYSFSLYEGFSYVISAEAYNARGERWNGFAKLTVTNPQKSLKLTLAPYSGEAKDWLEKHR